MLNYKPTFSVSSFTIIKRLFSSSSLSAINVYHPHIWGCWYFSWQSWFQLVIHPVQHFECWTLHISYISRVTLCSLTYFFPNLEPVCRSNCCFLACIQVSQEAGKVIRYSHFFKNFPQFVVIHRVKSFKIVREEEVVIFLEFPCFHCGPVNVGNLISGSSAYCKPRLYIWAFSVHILLKLSLKDFEHNKSVQLSGSLNILWYCPLLGLEWKLSFSSPVANGEFLKFTGILSAML